MKKSDHPPGKSSPQSKPDHAADPTSKPADKDYKSQPDHEAKPEPDDSKSNPDRSFPGPEPEYICGLPDLGPGDSTMLASNGEVIVASGARVIAYQLEGFAARLAWKAEFHATVAALAE